MPIPAYIIVNRSGQPTWNADRIIVYRHKSLAESVARDAGEGNRVVEVVVSEVLLEVSIGG